MLVLEPEVEEAAATVELDPVSRILESAAEVVKQGWIKGSYHRHTAEGHLHCTVGALIRAGNGEFNSNDFPVCPMPADYLMGDVTNAHYRMCSFLGILRNHLSNWNDDPSRTQDEVITALQCAARWKP